jgi:hypothetical protein
VHVIYDRTVFSLDPAMGSLVATPGCSDLNNINVAFLGSSVHQLPPVALVVAGGGQEFLADLWPSLGTATPGFFSSPEAPPPCFLTSAKVVRAAWPKSGDMSTPTPPATRPHSDLEVHKSP